MKCREVLVVVCLLATMLIGISHGAAAEKTNTGLKRQLPDPDTKPAAMDKPVKVFILLGQSNMLGFGRIGPEDKKGTLGNLTKKEDKYPHLLDDQGEWTQRKEVRYVQVMHRRGKMSTLRNEWLTVRGAHIGVELQFGHIIGHVLDEPVLVLKSCIGNRSLGWDLLPPGSERFTYDGRTYAGYKDRPSSWVERQPKKKVNWYAGKQYDDDIANAKKVLADIRKYYPGAKSYEAAGFVWWQGHKDQNPAHASRYEQNLVHLIKTLRKDFNAPQAKFVLATIAFGGWGLKGPGLTVANAQAVFADRQDRRRLQEPRVDRLAPDLPAAHQRRRKVRPARVVRAFRAALLRHSDLGRTPARPRGAEPLDAGRLDGELRRPLAVELVGRPVGAGLPARDAGAAVSKGLHQGASGPMGRRRPRRAEGRRQADRHGRAVERVGAVSEEGDRRRQARRGRPGRRGPRRGGCLDQGRKDHEGQDHGHGQEDRRRRRRRHHHPGRRVQQTAEQHREDPLHEELLRRDAVALQPSGRQGRGVRVHIPGPQGREVRAQGARCDGEPGPASPADAERRQDADRHRLALPVGMWERTKPLEIELVKGRNVLHFTRNVPNYGLTVKHFTLTPVK